MKKCPFCNLGEHGIGRKGVAIYVVCKSCGAKGPIAANAADALAKWNEQVCHRVCFRSVDLILGDIPVSSTKKPKKQDTEYDQD